MLNADITAQQPLPLHVCSTFSVHGCFVHTHCLMSWAGNARLLEWLTWKDLAERCAIHAHKFDKYSSSLLFVRYGKTACCSFARDAANRSKRQRLQFAGKAVHLKGPGTQTSFLHQANRSCTKQCHEDGTWLLAGRARQGPAYQGVARLVEWSIARSIAVCFCAF